MRFLYVFLLSLGSILLLCTFLPKKASMTQKYGSVIILNGPSGAGKSSIQRKLQELMMPDVWIKVGIDTLFDGPLPDINLENLAYWQQPNPIRWVETTADQDGKQVITLFVGEQGEKVIYGMNSAIAAYAQNGCNVIVDYIAYKKEWIDDLQDQLKDVTTCWVKVAIPLDVLELREAARGTSPQGHARSHYNYVYWDIAYDLEVDSNAQSAVEIAQTIKDFLEI